MKFFALFLLSAACCLAEETQPVSPADKEPLPYYSKVSEKVARILPNAHILQHKLDDSISRKAWTNLMTSFDYDRSYFLQSDLDAFAEKLTQIDNDVEDGKLDFPYEVYRVFSKRLGERYDFVTNMLANPIDFSVNEEYSWKRTEAPWPKDKAEQDDIWRKRVKNEYLAQTLARELDKESSTNKVEETSATNAPPPSVEENISEKYKQYKMIIEDMDSETIFQRYLTAVAMAYDPHSEYMSPMKKEDFEIDMNLSLIGIGCQLRSVDGTAMVAEIIPGGPIDCDKRPNKLVKGDKIIGVGQGKDGEIESILHQPLNRVVRKIRGKKGTICRLKYIPVSDPSGASTKTIDIVRDEVKLEEQAATGHVARVTLESGKIRALGYVRLPTFYGTMDKRPGQNGYRSATADVADYISSFNAEDVEGLVLDLRNNGGGSLREAVDLAGVFVRSGPAVQVREPKQIVVLNVRNSNSLPTFRKPMIVLINRASASASEIVAAALQDYGRALIVGDRQSHGKGTVQSVMNLGRKEYGSLKATTASFYRINGSSTQIKGVASDIVLPSPLDGLDFMGEDKLPGALPWSKIEEALYIPVGDVSKFVPQLSEKSKSRLATNERYSRYIRGTERIKELSQRKSVPLQIEQRKKLMKEERELRKLEEMEEENTGKAKDEEEDVVLQETFNILSDLVDLQGDGGLPLETEGDLRSRMMRIFGIGG